MRGARRFFTIGVAFSALFLSGLLAPAVASAEPAVKVLLSDLSSPKGLALIPHGDPIVAQGAFGAPGPVLDYVLRGSHKGSTVELTEPLNLMDVAVGADGAGWGIGGDRVLYRQAPDGPIEPILDIPAYQEGDPDPYDQEDEPTESNPYGLAVLPSGDALVTDAAGNDLIRVTPDGDATTVARFDVEAISTDHIPPEEGLPPTIDAEAVPTSVTLGPDGWVYVGELKGFPFRPETSHVWRVDPTAEGALCSVNTPDPDCSVVAQGFTAIQDIAFDRQTSTLYVYELAADGVLAFEEGLNGGDFPPAVLLEVKKNKRTELAAGQLSQPGGVAVLNRGTVFVTDRLFTQGHGRLIEVHR
jgi:hypothetical protein